jgi:hypothetical protein
VPADKKWYRNWAVANLLAETLEVVGPRFPKPISMSTPSWRRWRVLASRTERLRECGA